VGGSNRTADNQFLFRAIRIGRQKLELADVGIVIAVKRNVLAVYRKCGVGINAMR